MIRELDLNIVKTPKKFEPSSLIGDVGRIPKSAIKPHHLVPSCGPVSNQIKDGFERFHTGGWKFARVDFNNKYKLINSIPILRETLELLGKPLARQNLNGINEILSWIEAPLTRCRILILEAGHKINPHVGNGRQEELVRLLIPLQTHPDVIHYAGSSSSHLGAGEVWYLNQRRKHWVENNSDVDRYLLAVDTLPNPWIKELILNGEKY